MNTWVKYIDRSYASIKASITQALGTVVPELTDRSPSNLLMVVVDMFAGVGELLNYYLDITARELFLPTARRFQSMVKLAELANYNGKARTASYAVVTMTAEDATNTTVAAPSDFTIPVGVVLRDIENNKWTTQHAQVFRKGYKTTQINVSQYESVIGAVLGISDGSVAQQFPLPAAYKDSSLSITIDAVNWELVESFGGSTPTDKHCLVKILTDGLMYVTFGDGTNGLVPTNGSSIIADYYSTMGLAGNTEVGTITTIVSGLALPPGVDHLVVTNNQAGVGGREVEGIEELRRAIPIALRTLNRAVAKKDYEDIATLSADIRAARVVWGCGAEVQVYLVAHGGGNPPTSILDETKTFIENRAMATIPIVTLPSGETHIRGNITIVGRFRALPSVIDTKAREVLQELYNPYTSKINQDVRLSDIIAAIDNIPEVDYLTLEYIYAQPYLRPSNPAAPLEYTIEVLSSASVKSQWKILYDPASDAAKPFMVSKEGVFLVKLAEGETVNDVGGLLNISIPSTPGSVVQDDNWTFVVYPYNKDVTLDDLSIPIIGPEDFTLDIIQTYTPL